MSTEAASTVLVTGALGQVGKRLTEILLVRGLTVVALDLDTEENVVGATALTPGPGQPGQLVPSFVNLVDVDAVHAVVEEHQPHAIVHLAAVVSPPCYRSPEQARRVNVDGTANLVAAAQTLPSPPMFILASSSAVYGSRNPYNKSGRITPATPAKPVDCYGEDKIAAEGIVAGSGLPHAVLRLGGIISPDGLARTGPDYLVMMRAIPRDNRVHLVDARDVALAFANAVDRADSVDGKILLIGGDESCVMTHAVVQDDVFAAIGIGRVGPSINLPGDPHDDRGWGLTDWFDTTESEDLLSFQQHSWSQTLSWLGASQGRRRTAMRIAGPVVRPALRGFLAVLRRKEHRGPYADPWTFISAIYGSHILAGSTTGSSGHP